MMRIRGKRFGQVAVYGKAASGGGGGGIAFTETDAQTVASGFSPGSFASVAIGAASADRIVVMGYQTDSGTNLPAPTYNGGSAWSVASAGVAVSDQIGLYYANIPSGTTMTVEFPGGSQSISIAVGILKGQSGGGSATSANAVVNTAVGAQPLTVSLTVPAGGIGIAVAGNKAGAVAPTFTWTGTTAGAGDKTSGDANSQISLAHSTSTGTVGVSSSSSLSFGGTLAAASWAS
jgi:hypothetical protein